LGANFGWMAFWGSKAELRSRVHGARRGSGAFVKSPRRLLSYTLVFALKLRKNHGKTSVRVSEKCQLRTIRFVVRAALAAVEDSNHQHPRLALRVGQINPSSEQIPVELPN
jgi:hypothetical protein